MSDLISTRQVAARLEVTPPRSACARAPPRGLPQADLVGRALVLGCGRDRAVVVDGGSQRRSTARELTGSVGSTVLRDGAAERDVCFTILRFSGNGPRRREVMSMATTIAIQALVLLAALSIIDRLSR